MRETPAADALARNQFALVMALCVEDHNYPSRSPVFGGCVTESINVSDIVDFILWGAWLEERDITIRLLGAVCALLENYKARIIQLWPDAKAGVIAYRAIMCMMHVKGLGIIGEVLKYRMAMSAISNLADELLGPLDDSTSSIFSTTSPSAFNVFATDIYIPHIIPRQPLHHQATLLDIINTKGASVDVEVAEMHSTLWGSTSYIQPCSEPLKLISKVSKAPDSQNLQMSLSDVYVAAMAISGLLASNQMIVTAVKTGNMRKGYKHIMDFVECRLKIADVMRKKKQLLQEKEAETRLLHLDNSPLADGQQATRDQKNILVDPAMPAPVAVYKDRASHTRSPANQRGPVN